MSGPDRSSPSGPSPRPALHVPLLVAVLFLLATFKGLRLPSRWATTHMTFNYSQGFIRRGLVGQILRVFGEDLCFRYNFLFVVAVVLLLAAGLGLFLLVRRLLASDRGDHGLQAAILVLAASPGVVFLIHEIGYLDYVGMVALPFFVLLAARSRRLFVVFYLVVPLLVVLALVHESMIVMFAPTLLFTLVCHIVGRGAGQPARVRYLLAGHGILVAAIAVLASTLVGTVGTGSPTQLQALQEAIARHANFALRGDAFDTLQRSMKENLLVVLPTHWSHAENRNYLLTSLGVTIPGLAFLASYGVRLIFALGIASRARLLLVVMFLSATLAPLLLNFIGWDTARWNSIAFLACFHCLASVRLVLLPAAATPDTDGGPRRLAGPWTLTWAAIAIVLGLCTSYQGYLFDGNLVQWFPFIGQFDSAIQLVKGGFTAIP